MESKEKEKLLSNYFVAVNLAVNNAIDLLEVSRNVKGDKLTESDYEMFKAYYFTNKENNMYRVAKRFMKTEFIMLLYLNEGKSTATALGDLIFAYGLEEDAKVITDRAKREFNEKLMECCDLQEEAK